MLHNDKLNNDYYNSKEFEDKYHYDGPLGSFCQEDGTAFYVWAPTAEKVRLCLYEKGDGEGSLCQLEMAASERGVWEYHSSRKLDGSYYDYLVTVDGVTRQTADPYAKAAGVNGSRSMVIDLERTNPPGWEQDRAPQRTSENIIYEVHVKDFSWDPSSGIDPGKRGRYPGLCQSGTTLNGDGIHPTGMDYLKELGITHVQLMPVYDFGSVDEALREETAGAEQFNWGYDPLNYNLPEGSYSTDPFHGEVRIRELKEAIRILHRNGFRVIMDVVYNHTYALDSFLNRMVPGYYYRFDPEGKPSNGSGCGNDTASERSMCARYILDSVLYWAEEYHFDGFRFDLMGLMPVELMNRIRQALDERFGRGEKLLFGEPWRAADTCARPGTLLADKAHLTLLDPLVGAFCDTTRDMIKGNVMQESARGLVNGGRFEKALFEGCLRGWAGIRGEYSVLAASQTICYLSCHDDWTLWDRLVNTLDEKRCYEGDSEAALAANRMAAALLMACQGNLFLLSGEESARTKLGIKNSFCSSIRINRLDWERVWKEEALMNYYQGLFALRRQLPFLCDKSEKAAGCFRRVEQVTDSCVSVEMAGEAGGGSWDNALFLYNFGSRPFRAELPEGEWQLLSDGCSSYCWKAPQFQTKRVTVPPKAAMILGRSSGR